MSNQTFIEQLAEKLRAIGSLKAVGDTWISFDSSVPPGGVPFCGQEVTRALYADLWAWAQAQGKVKTELEWQEHAMANGGNCPYYSSGNGSTTFRMPCVLGYFKGSSVTTEGGTYKPQKLPNIKGSGIPFENINSINLMPPRTGAIYDITTVQNYLGHFGGDKDNIQLGFNANLYDDRYQDGADVQPETYQVLVGVYAVGVIQNINNTDVQQLQTGLATLEANAVKSVNGVTPTAGNVDIDTSSRQYMPYYEGEESVTTFPYIVPKDGAFYASSSTNDSTWAELYVNGKRVYQSDISAYTLVTSTVVLVSKGDSVTKGGTTNGCKFFPLNVNK